MSRRLRISVLVLGALLLSALALRYLIIPSYGPALLGGLLSRWGVTESVIDEVSLAPGGMRIGRANLAWKPTDGAASSMLGKIETLQFSGTFSSLSEGRISNASADSLSFEIVAGKSGKSRAGDIRDVWKSALRLFPPVSTVQIKKFSFLWSDPATGRSLRLQGRAAYDEPTLTLVPGATLSMTLGEQGTLHAELASRLRMSRSADGQDISVDPFTLRLTSVPAIQGVSVNGLELRTERFLLMEQGASGKGTVKGSIVMPERPEFQFGPFELGAELQFLPSGGLIPRAEVQLDMAQLNVGFPLSDLRTRFLLVPHGEALEAATVSLHEAAVKVFGATISTAGAELNLKNPRLDSSVVVRGLNLKELLEFYPSGKVTGHGTVDGTLQLRVSAQSNIGEGTFEARPPGGTLSGDLNDWATAHPDNQGVALAARALKNFHYTSLAGTANYQENGQLLLQVQLKGSNPELGQGQIVNFNVNIEENLPALFRSLRLMRQGPKGLEKIGG